MANPLRQDPTRTTLIRRKFTAETKRRFNTIWTAVRDLILDDDIFGMEEMPKLKINNQAGLPPKAWAFKTSSEKVTEFNKWLKQQIDLKILDTDFKDASWTEKYVDSAYRKGSVQAYTDYHKQDLATKGKDFYAGGMEGFLKQAFAQPERKSKLQLIFTQTYEELKGITSVMAQQMSRSLASGLANGSGPMEIARDLHKNITGISRSRAEALARTEVIRAHAEGALDSMEDMGLEKAELQAEWSTAGDDAVCELCEPLDGKIMLLEEARGMIPRHVNCRCAWLPVIGDE